MPRLPPFALPLLAAALTVAWLWLPTRPPPVRTTEVDAPTLRAMHAPGHITGVPGDLRVAAPAGSPCSVRVRPIAQAEPSSLTTLHFALDPQPTPDLACAKRQDLIVNVLRDTDFQPDGIRPGDVTIPRTPFDTVLLTLTAAGLGALIVLGFRLLRALPRPVLRTFAVVLALAFLVRALAPHRLTTVFFAYEWFAQARFLDSLPRYGPGSTALWGLVLGPLTVDHAWILWLHALLGSLTVAVAAAWLQLASGPRAAWVGGVLLGLTPLLVREHVSESMHVPALLCVLVAALGVLQDRRVLAGLALGLAPLFRGDLLPLAVPTVLVLTWVARRRLRLDRQWLGGLALLTLGTALATVHTIHREQIDAAHGNLPQLQRYLPALKGHLLHDALPWRPDWLPGGLWLPVVAWLALGRKEGRLHHRWLALIPLAVLWILPGFLDFNETSLPRLQMPAAVLLCLCAAGLTDQLAEVLRPHRWPVAVLLLAWLASAWPTLPVAFHKTNAHLEDDLLRQTAHELAGRRLQGQDAWLVTRTYAEGPAVGIHLHFPTYLFPGVRIVTATDWLTHLQRSALGRGRVPPERSEPTAAWFLRSVRCWAHPVQEGGPLREHAACQAVAQRARPTSIRARLPNLRDSPTFDYYGPGQAMDVGVLVLRQPEPEGARE